MDNKPPDKKLTRAEIHSRAELCIAIDHEVCPDCLGVFGDPDNMCGRLPLGMNGYGCTKPHGHDGDHVRCGASGVPLEYTRTTWRKTESMREFRWESKDG